MKKNEAELSYWQSRYNIEKNNFGNFWYKKLMMSILEVTDEDVFKDKIILDFGCGPRGSLRWIHNAKLCIGADVLVPLYFKNFGKTMITHNMLYLTTTEDYIPT